MDVAKGADKSGSATGFDGLHQHVEFVRGQSKSQLVEWGHGELHIEKEGNAATPLWFSECISLFRRRLRCEASLGRHQGRTGRRVTCRWQGRS